MAEQPEKSTRRQSVFTAAFPAFLAAVFSAAMVSTVGFGVDSATHRARLSADTSACQRRLESLEGKSDDAFNAIQQTRDAIVAVTELIAAIRGDLQTHIEVAQAAEQVNKRSAKVAFENRERLIKIETKAER
jgi:ribosomal protein S12 methylthiotransferase accessory factor YcaO